MHVDSKNLIQASNKKKLAFFFWSIKSLGKGAFESSIFQVFLCIFYQEELLPAKFEFKRSKQSIRIFTNSTNAL